MRFFNWFYRFYSLGDFIRGTILFLVFLLVCVPFDIWAVQMVRLGPSYTYLVLAVAIQSINLGVYIHAIVFWIKYTKKKRMMEVMQKDQPKVDKIWLSNDQQ